MTTKENILELLRAVDREGMDKIIAWLCDGDQYFVAAGSQDKHDSWIGGLADHSLEVCQNALEDWKARDEVFRTKYPRESVIIASLLHDACKIDVYAPGDNGFPGKNRELRKLGHGPNAAFYNIFGKWE